MSEQVERRNFLAESSSDSADTARIVSFPRPESPWMYNMAYKEFIGDDSFYSENLIPTSPLMSPPSSPIWNSNISADHDNIDTSFAKDIYAKTRTLISILRCVAEFHLLQIQCLERCKLEDPKSYSDKSAEEEVARSHDVGNSTPKLKDTSLSENIVEANSFNHLSLTTISTSPPGAGGCTLERCNRSSILVNQEAEEVTLLTSREIMDEQLHSSLPLTQTTEPVKSELVQLETLPDQIDMMIPSLSELQTHVGTSAQNLSATTTVKKQKKRKISSTTGGRSKKFISLEDLQRHSHLCLKEAARSLQVSKSTVKRRCRENGISEWSELKVLNVSQKSKEAEAINLDVDSIIVKVYGNTIIKLELSSSSNKVDLEKEVATLLNLEVGSFGLNYKDEDDDWVLIAREFNWRDCKHTSRSLGKTVIKLLVS